MNLRLPTDLHQALKHAAQREHRSLHAEILSRLEEPFTIAPNLPVNAGAADCPNVRNHRPGAFCKTCGGP